MEEIIWSEDSMKKKRKIRCSSCNNLFEQKDMIYGPDPFREEICGDDDPVWLCDDCHYDSCMEI